MKLTLPSFDFIAPNVSEMTRNVLDIGLALLVIPNLAPKRSWLFEIDYGVMSAAILHQTQGQRRHTFSNLAQISVSASNPGLMSGQTLMFASIEIDSALLRRIRKRLNGALIVGSTTLRNVGLRPIALEVGNRHNRLVNRDLLIISTQTMTMSIRVREQSRLQDRIERGLDERDKVRWRERALFNLREVVLRVLIQNELPDGTQGEFSVGPDLGEVENVVPELLCLFGSHRLLIVV